MLDGTPEHPDQETMLEKQGAVTIPVPAEV
jgi:hypothetical protein